MSIIRTAYLYSSGGGGHQQAMEALKNADFKYTLKSKQIMSNFQPICIDIMIHWLGLIGLFAVTQWNNAQKEGNVKKQLQLISKQSFANMLFGPTIFRKTYLLLQQNPQIIQIINTQVMCLRNMCQAVLKINSNFKRNVQIIWVLTDLPTHKSIHFWNGLKLLSHKEKSILIIHCLKPLSNFQLEFGLKYEFISPPVRSEFFLGNHRSLIEINDDGYLLFDQKNKKISIARKEICISIMLGSQGGEIILQYIIQLIKYLNSKKYLFLVIIFCGHNKSLYKQIRGLIKSLKLTKNIRIIPFKNQEALAIAEILERSDILISKTGGLTCFEILVINNQNANKEFLLHSEKNQGMIIWEEGNAEYLIQYLKFAKIVHFDNFILKSKILQSI